MDSVDRILGQWAVERPDLDTSVMGLVGRLSRVAVIVAALQKKTFAQHGLDGASFDVLATLRRSGPPYRLASSALTSASMITTGATTQRVDKLERAGLVRRSPDPDDGRGALVQLTAAGRRLVDRALPDHVATEWDVVAGLSAAQQDQLARLLSRMLTHLEQPVDGH